ncbi:hypothetical protein HIM_06626 [Hirsutella minnesotensis 3608]|uniref:Cytochrome b561 domain-containing protein n=1 Tax=Hirsutella minnesotensis 3608 TaxID=1043627 RepID=A0A0F7ZTZ2_9HYPO|nr:hypothetical protein HIM_06626 [Hirsutella minnesotensis 3608]
MQPPIIIKALGLALASTLVSGAETTSNTGPLESSPSRVPGSAPWRLCDLVAAQAAVAMSTDGRSHETYGAVMGLCFKVSEELAGGLSLPSLSHVRDEQACDSRGEGGEATSPMELKRRAATASEAKRDMVKRRASEPKEPSYSRIQARQNGILDPTNLLGAGANLPNPLAGITGPRGIIRINALSTILQRTLNSLNCEGVAGLVLILIGQSKKQAPSGGAAQGDDAHNDPIKGIVNTFFNGNVTTQLIQSILPEGDIHLTNDRNTYDIDAQKVSRAFNGSAMDAVDAIRINETKVVPLATFLAIHVLVAFVFLGVLVPLALTMHSVRNILQQMQASKAVPGWTFRVTQVIWYLGLPPSLIVILVFGVLPAAKNGHFQTLHGVVGLLTLLLAVPAVALFYLSTSTAAIFAPYASMSTVAFRLTSQALLLFTLVASITGLTDLRSIVLCTTAIVPIDLAALLGFVLGALLMMGGTASILELLVQWRGPKASDFVREVPRKSGLEPTAEEVGVAVLDRGEPSVKV